jgi:hypothetical protein
MTQSLPLAAASGEAGMGEGRLNMHETHRNSNIQDERKGKETGAHVHLPPTSSALNT